MGDRALTAGQALLWAAGAAMLTWVGLGVTVAVRPAAATDIVTVAAVEAVALLTATLFVLRVYAPERAAPAALGVRATHPGFAALGVALGLVLHVPAESLRNLMEQLVPTPESDLAQRALLLGTEGWAEVVALFVVVAAVVPLVEELLIRGALYGGVVRSSSPTHAVGVTAIAFVVLHLLQWRNAPALLLAGGVLSYLRAASGSLVPPLALHVAFNATTVLALATGAGSATDPLVTTWPVTLGGWAALLGLLYGAQWLSVRSPEAAIARATDET